MKPKPPKPVTVVHGKRQLDKYYRSEPYLTDLGNRADSIANFLRAIGWRIVEMRQEFEGLAIAVAGLEESIRNLKKDAK